jgi:hypothetical protein
METVLNTIFTLLFPAVFIYFVCLNNYRIKYETSPDYAEKQAKRQARFDDMMRRYAEYGVSVPDYHVKRNRISELAFVHLMTPEHLAVFREKQKKYIIIGAIGEFLPLLIFLSPLDSMWESMPVTVLQIVFFFIFIRLFMVLSYQAIDECEELEEYKGVYPRSWFRYRHHGWF